MNPAFKARWERVRSGRVRILWLVLGALLLVSALPSGLYHRQVLQLSQDKLVDTERVQQTDLTRSLAQEIQQFESNLTQQLLSERQILALTGLIDNVEDTAAEPKVTRLLERTVFLVDHNGRLVAHQDTKNFVPGADVSSNSLVAQVKALPQELRNTETVRFAETNKKHRIEMIGTYSTIPELNWTVIAQRRLDQAQSDTGVTELNRQALAFVSIVILAAILVGYFFAVGISGPIRGLAASTRAISRGEFHQRSLVRGASEISELAENFNKMAGDIEEYIERLKEAAEENRELFIGSIRMLAAAIDEKDPYTRGHSGRVAKYSMLIGQELGLSTEELDKLRISALLHDVGKIGVEDRVLKKPGALTPEEFGLMKQRGDAQLVQFFGAEPEFLPD